MEHLYFWLTALSRCCREDLVILHAVAMRLVTHICNLCLLLKIVPDAVSHTVRCIQ